MSERTVELVTGRMKMGKTTLAYHRAQQIYPGKCVFVFDTCSNFGPFDGSGFIFVHEFAGMRRAIEQQPAPRAIIFQPAHVDEGFSEFAKVAMSCTRHAVLVDESRWLQSAQRINHDLALMVCSATGRSARYGELSVILTQHRVSDINAILQELVHHYYFFATKRVRTLEKIEEIAGAEAAAHVVALDAKQYLHWDVGAENWTVNRDPRSWREQISSTKKEAVNGE